MFFLEQKKYRWGIRLLQQDLKDGLITKGHRIMNLNKANGWSSILGRTLNAFERNRCKFLNNLVFSETMQNKDVYNLLLMKKKK